MIVARIGRMRAAIALPILIAAGGALLAQGPTASSMDRDLSELTVARLQSLYAARTYTVSEVIRWHLDRIARYDGVYRAMLRVDRTGAIDAAAALDREPSASRRGALWGVPIVIKANTGVKGLITSNGWQGYLIPGHEWVAPKDAAVVAKLRAAGAVILGHTNMPDFASGDTTVSSAGGRTGNAYDWRFSSGGSSGGTVTAVAAGFAVLGTGTDTSNSIRTPSGASGVVGVLPTRGLVSTAGIHPLDWLLDNAGPIARTVADAAAALDVMTGEDPRDFRTAGSAAKAQGQNSAAPTVASAALKGKRFGVPAFMLAETGSPNLERETRAIFMKALDGLRAAGADVVADAALLPDSFPRLIDAVKTEPYIMEGINAYFREFGPAGYHSPGEFDRTVGLPFPLAPRSQSAQPLARDPNGDRNFRLPQQKALAAYEESLDRFHLDGFVYPALHTPANDETALLSAAIGGPHSRTAWVNVIGVPAVVVPAGYYANGLPFGIELSARPWKDRDLLGWAQAYEQALKIRRPPVLKEK